MNWEDEKHFRFKPKAAARHAEEVLKARWIEVEPVIAQNTKAACRYARLVMKARWSEIEPAIQRSPTMSYEYARDVLKTRWPEVESSIQRSPQIAYLYARDVVKGRWLEAELDILKMPNIAYLYAKDVIRGRWIEAEPDILRTDYMAFQYARDVIKGRWPEAEDVIKGDGSLEYRNKGSCVIHATYLYDYLEFLESLEFSKEDQLAWLQKEGVTDFLFKLLNGTNMSGKSEFQEIDDTLGNGFKMGIDKPIPGLSTMCPEAQEIVIQKRPDLICEIRNLDPFLKAKYWHEVGLSAIDA